MNPQIAVLMGGVSSEREVSLKSGAAVFSALLETFPDAVLMDVQTPALPADLNPRKHVVFSVMHGTFGEDGQFQELCDRAGVHYCGCHAASSRLCMNKALTKDTVSAAGVPVIPGMIYSAEHRPTAESVVRELGAHVVFKPVAEGSSVGLSFADTAEAVAAILATHESGEWMVEKRIYGRELTVGVLGGNAMGVVEIIPDSGVYDYESKYTPGTTRYEFPANLSDAVTETLRNYAETAFKAAQCRDFARIDFLLTDDQTPWFLEINTLPGLTATSLLPKSASCAGINFPELACRMIQPAIQRFKLQHPAHDVQPQTT